MYRIRVATRSRFLFVAITALLASGWLWLANKSPAAPPAAAPTAVDPVEPGEPDAHPLGPDAALERLLAGNRRYAAAMLERPNDSAQRRVELKDSQHPFAIVVGCADSRVAPELVFDQGLGDIFVVRVAGNVAEPAVVGSVTYAVYHLHAPLLVVLGHENCGAVKAALMTPAELAKEPEAIRALVGFVQPALKDVPPGLSGKEQLRTAISANVHQAINQLEDVPTIKEAVAGHHLKIVGGVYSLDSGKVELLP